MFSVYTHENLINGKVYVGITSQNPRERWQNGEGYSKNKKFYADIKEYGWNNFKHEVVADGLTEEQAVAIEKAMIAGYKATKRGYNNSEGGKYVPKRNLCPTANKIKNSLKKHTQFPRFKTWLEVFESAEEAGAESNFCRNINIHCEQIVKQMEKDGTPFDYSDSVWLDQFIYNIERNMWHVLYFDVFGTKEEFEEIWPDYWEMKRTLFGSGKKTLKQVDEEICKLTELILAKEREEQ